MDVGNLLSLLLGGLVVGSLARLAVPGPDPMPLWLTVGIGVVSVFLGGGVGFAVGAELGALAGAVLCATLVVIGYRRVVQKRGITGPQAHRFPGRGVGIGGRRRKLGLDPAPDAGDETAENLRKLAELRDAGILTNEEFEAKKTALFART